MKSIEFQEITLDDQAIFADFLSRFPTESCERGWANLRLYRDSYDWHYAVVDGRLLTVSFRSGHVQFPLGADLEPAALSDLLRGVAGIGGWQPGCYDMPEAYVERHPDFGRFFEVEFDPGEADYIYDLARLNAFAGARLRKKHNLVRQFERDYAGRFRVEKLNGQNLGDLLALARRINSYYSDEGSIAEENRALVRLEQEFGEPTLNLGGIVLYVMDRAAGFSVYSRLCGGLADIHFEKADREFHGSGAMVTAKLVEQLLSENFTAMNREQDLGEPGLRQAKQSLDCDHLYRRGNARSLSI